MKDIMSAFVCLRGYELSKDEAKLLSQYNPVGVVLFRRNIDNPTQIKKLTDDIRDAINRPDVLIAVDQEGGAVQRLKNQKYWRNYVPQRAIGNMSESDATNMIRAQGTLIANDLRVVGINVNFAPTSDVLHKNTTPALQSRCFSEYPNVVANYASLLAQTYMQNGICPCMKHLPGHGLATDNSHLGATVINATMAEIEQDIIPFQKMAGFIPMAMTAHIIANAIDDKPITQSKKGIDFIRCKIGFPGLIVSDAIEMHALNGTLSERVITSLDAGCDIVCYCSGHNQNNENMTSDVAEVLKSCRPLSDNAYFYLDKIKHEIFNTASTDDISIYEKTYDNLLKKIPDNDLRDSDYTENWSDKD